MFARFVVALCAAFSVSAFAFSSSTSGNQTTFGPFTATAQNVAPYTLSTASDGRVLITGDRRIPLAGGGSFPVSLQGSVGRASAAGAVGRFLTRVSPLGQLASIGAATVVLLNELGFTSDDVSGSTVFGKPIAGACAVGPCFEYQATATVGGLGRTGGYARTRQATASAAVAARVAAQFSSPCVPGQTTGQTHRGELVSVGSTTFEWRFITISTNCSSGAVSENPSTQIGSIASRSRAPDTQLTEPATIAEIQAAIEAQNVWNPNSKLGAALKDAIGAGEPVAVPQPAVTGPASVPGASSTTVDNATGQTTVVQQTVNNAYSGPTVTTTTVTTTTVTNTATGEPVSQSVKTETPVVELPVSPETETPPFAMPCGVAGTPPCAVAVDETGVALPETIKNDQADDKLDEWDNFVTNIGDILPPFPTINWAFVLPTACGVIPLPAFEPAITEVDVCQFQPMFHQLMTVVWTLGGLFGAISLFMRSSLSTN